MALLGKILSFFWQTSILYIVFFLVVLYLIFDNWRNRTINEKLSYSQNIRKLPFIGYMHYYFKFNNFGHKTMNPFSAHEWFRKIFEIIKMCSCPTVAWIFYLPLVIVKTSRNAQIALSVMHSRGLVRLFKNSLSNAIILNTGERWRKTRRILQSVLTTSMLEKYMPIINHYSDSLSNKIQIFADTNMEFDISNYLFNANIDITLDNMAGYKMRTLEDDKNYIYSIFEEEVCLDSMRLRYPLLYSDLGYSIFLRLTGKVKISQETKKLTSSVVDAISQKMATESYKLQEPDHQKTYLELLLNDYNSKTAGSFTYQNVRDELLNILEAGAATTARAVGFTLLMLATHPNVQQKVYREITTVLGNKGRPIEMDDLTDFEYLEQCFKETLRKFPPVALTARQHHEDVVLTDELTIPANCHVAVSLYSMHNDEKVFPSPETWDPDRFSAKAIVNRDKNVFLPFGIGPRMCPGNRYAMLSAKIQLAYVIRKYHITTEMKMSDIVLEMDAVLKSTNGYRLKLHHRNV